MPANAGYDAADAGDDPEDAADDPSDAAGDDPGANREKLPLSPLTPRDGEEHASAPSWQSVDGHNTEDGWYEPEADSGALALSASARIRVFAVGGEAPLLDICAEDVTWVRRDGTSLRLFHPQNLCVEDAMDLMQVSPNYTHFYNLNNLTPMDLHDELVWGHSYQLVTTRCPRCTMCAAPCARTTERHVLCSHGPSMTSVHLWHDIGHQRSALWQVWACCHVTVQGYADGDGLENYFTPWDSSLQSEIQAIAREWTDELGAPRARLHLLAWQQRRPLLRQAIATAMEEMDSASPGAEGSS